MFLVLRATRVSIPMIMSLITIPTVCASGSVRTGISCLTTSKLRKCYFSVCDSCINATLYCLDCLLKYLNNVCYNMFVFGTLIVTIKLNLYELYNNNNLNKNENSTFNI